MLENTEIKSHFYWNFLQGIVNAPVLNIIFGLWHRSFSLDVGVERFKNLMSMAWEFPRSWSIYTTTFPEIHISRVKWWDHGSNFLGSRSVIENILCFLFIVNLKANGENFSHNPMGKIHTIFFFKIGVRHWASVHEKKIACFGIWFSVATVVITIAWWLVTTVATRRGITTALYHVDSYYHYYSCHVIVVTTAVTTVATENRMTTHAIFFSCTDARCRAPFLRKNHILQSDDNNDDDKVRTALPGARERWAKNDDEWAGTSWVCTGSSHIVGTLRNHVSPRPQERVVMTVMGKCECSY